MFVSAAPLPCFRRRFLQPFRRALDGHGLGHYPAIVYQVAFAVNVMIQFASLLRFAISGLVTRTYLKIAGGG
jgi:hypothetical protein